MLTYSGYEIIAVEPGVVGAKVTKLQCKNDGCGFVLTFTARVSDLTLETCLGAHRQSCFMSLCAWCESEAGRVATEGLSHGICDAHTEAVMAEAKRA